MNLRISTAAPLVLMMLTVVLGKETTVTMDGDDPGNGCGSVVTLKPGDDLRLTSKGMAPDGYCGLTVFTPNTINNYTCDALCITFKTASISVCDAKLKFVGHTFGKGGDHFREFSCHERNTDAFCWPVNSVQVEAIESYKYAYVDQRKMYEFEVDVSARCSKDSVRKNYPFNSDKFHEDEHQTYVEGIAVGVSLACVFLIILFVAWCYTKHQAVTSTRSDSKPRPAPTPSTHKKGNIISTFRKKLHINRKSNADTEEEPEAVYRKTDDGAAAKRKESNPESTPLTKEPEVETFELANETIDSSATKEGSTGEDSPKDGGAESSNLDPPEVVINPATPEPSGDASD